MKTSSATNEKQKAKRRPSNRQVAYQDGLSVQEAQDLIQAPEPTIQPPAPPPAPPAQLVLPALAPATTLTNMR